MARQAPALLSALRFVLGSEALPSSFPLLRERRQPLRQRALPLSSKRRPCSRPWSKGLGAYT